MDGPLSKAVAGVAVGVAGARVLVGVNDGVVGVGGSKVSVFTPPGLLTSGVKGWMEGTGDDPFPVQAANKEAASRIEIKYLRINPPWSY